MLRKNEGKADVRKKMFGKKILLSLTTESYKRIAGEAEKMSMSVSVYIRDVLGKTQISYEQKKAIEGLQKTLEALAAALARLEAKIDAVKDIKDRVR